MKFCGEVDYGPVTNLFEWWQSEDFCALWITIHNNIRK